MVVCVGRTARRLSSSVAAVARRRRPGDSGGPAPSALRASAHLPRRVAQSTATRRPGDLCSVHAATFLTHYRELCIVSRFSVSRSLATTRNLPRPDPILSNNFSELLKFPRVSLVSSDCRSVVVGGSRRRELGVGRVCGPRAECEASGRPPPRCSRRRSVACPT